MNATLKTVSNGITRSLNGMRQREKALHGYLNRNVVEQYRNAQRTRWKTENTSEGQRWEKLNPGYALRKRKQFAAYPGSGTKMLIATNRLFESVIGPGKGFRKVVEPRRVSIFTTVEYATHVNEARNFTRWGKKTYSEMLGGIAKFISKGILKDVSELV